MEEDTVETTWRVGEPHQNTTVTEKVLLARHLAAYDYAAVRIRNMEIVIDAACGLGIGIEKLLASTRSIMAMDLARTALDSTKNRPELIKVQADATRIPIRSGAVDAVVAFQLIEHVQRDSAVAMLREFQRVLKPGGQAFVTTPNARWRLLPFQKPWNPYHIEEYNPVDFRRLCRDAGLLNYRILGLQGRFGAHEVELARVRQDPLEVYLRLPSRWRWYLNRLLRSNPMDQRHLSGLTERDGNKLFEFTDDYRHGIDFMLVIQK